MSILPHDCKPYNLRLYLLGKSKEGVFLRKPVIRKPKVKKSLLEAVRPTGNDGRSGPLLEGGSTRGDLSPRSPEELAENKQRAGRRAKSRVRRLIEANDLSRMLTLTFDTNEEAKVRTRSLSRRGSGAVDNLQNWEDARYYFGLFSERVRRKCKKLGVSYDLIAVPERQKRGVQHFHFATKLLFTHAEWLALWGYGTVWYSGGTGGRAGRRRENKDPGSSVAGVSSYMTKYLGKAFDEEPSEDPAGPGQESFRSAGAARYHRSRSLVLPFEEYLIEPGDMSGFQEKLEEGGFEVVGEPLAIEKDGMTFGWWHKSVQLAIERGDLSAGSAGRLCAPQGGQPPGGTAGGLPSHLTSGQLSLISES